MPNNAERPKPAIDAYVTINTPTIAIKQFERTENHQPSQSN